MLTAGPAAWTGFLDADFLSHAVLAVFDADLVRHMGDRGPGRFHAALREMVAALLDAPRS